MNHDEPTFGSLAHLPLSAAGGSFADRENVQRARLFSLPVVVKRFTSKQSHTTECQVLDALQAAGFPSPRVIQSVSSASEHMLVETCLEGRSADSVFESGDQATRARLAHEAGHLLALLHRAIPIETLRSLTFWHRAGCSCWAEYSWREYLHAQVEKWIGRVRLTDREKAEGLGEIVSSLQGMTRTLPEDAERTILHCDFTMRNLIYNPVANRLVGVIDFETALLGDPLYDVAKFLWVDVDDADTTARTRFVESWAATGGFEWRERRLALYIAIQALAAMAWVDKQSERTAQMLGFRTRAGKALAAARFGC